MRRIVGVSDKIGRFIVEQERWATIVRGGLLPTLFQSPPATFSVKPVGGSVRVLAFGDYGDGGDAQKRVAAAMLTYHQQHDVDFGITLGDNFYPSGMESPVDPRWQTWWSTLYDPLAIQFYASLGNHDWNHANSPAAEILFGQRRPSWRMPATCAPMSFISATLMRRTTVFAGNRRETSISSTRRAVRVPVVKGRIQRFRDSGFDDSAISDSR